MTSLERPSARWHDAPLARNLAAAAAGGALALAFAPFDLWPLAILAPAVLIALWDGATPRSAAALGFWFSAATFVAGTYWLYISIHVFGQAPLWIAFLLMLGLAAIMGVYHAALGYSIARWLPARGAWRWLAGVPAAWVLVEWFRGWFLSGFSWLSLGYAATDTPLARLAPIGGVYLLSALLLVMAGALVLAVRSRGRARLIAVAPLLAPWILAFAADRDWTRGAGTPVSVAILQGAIPQDLKWLRENRETTLELYAGLVRKAAGADLLVVPESALPDLANNLVDYLGGLYSVADARGSSLLIGVMRASDDGGQYFNSLLALTPSGIAWYDKRHLVPFGEFFPVPAFVREWMRLRSLPYSDFTSGAPAQPPLAAGGLALSATICYEDAYASTQLPALRAADALVNVTNDAWFGRSTARHQHFQIARLRAIESGRYLIRAANDGISAIVGPRGEVIAQAPEFEPAVLRGRVERRTGITPYMRIGNSGIVLAALAALAAAWWAGRRPMRQ